MSLRKLTPYLFIFLFVLFVPKESVLACECMAADVKADVSTAFQKAEIVMLARFESISELESGEWLDQQTVSVRIENIYKGELKVGSFFTLGQGQGCNKYFIKDEIGKSFLLYIGKPERILLRSPYDRTIIGKSEPRYFVSKCGRSSLAEKAEKDLVFLKTKSASESQQPI